MAAVNDKPYPRFFKNIAYSEESSLNSLDICLPAVTSSSDPSRLWIVFIHGGAWRDPAIDASSFEKTQQLLLSSPVAASIAGLASLNYRLSSYPSHKTDPSSPDDPARNARHPDHINDVLAALLYLQEKYQFEERYVLAGHSCGATLALQVAMKRYWGSQYESTLALELNVVPPTAVVGLEGLYDLPAYVMSHVKEPVVQDFIENAFGPEKEIWKAASPAYADFEDSWQDGQLVVLGHSNGDELVEWEQCALMEKALKAQTWKENSNERQLKVLELSGKHDEVWQDGKEAARAIGAAIEIVVRAL